MRRAAPITALLFAAGCASGGAHEMHTFGSSRVDLDAIELEDGEALAVSKRTRKRVPVDDIAKGYRTPQLCEQGARGLLSVDEGKAWALMAACAAREDYTSIDSVLAHPWLAQVKRRQRAGAELVSRIVANRGGNLKLDLNLVNDRGVQLFGLETVMKNARVFRGRYVLLRAKIGAVAAHGTGVRVHLDETALRAHNIERNYTYRRARAARREGRSLDAVRRSRNGKIVVDSLTVSQPTHRSLDAFTERPLSGVETGEERLVLVRFADAKPVPGAEETGAMTGTAALVAVYNPIDDVVR